MHQNDATDTGPKPAPLRLGGPLPSPTDDGLDEDLPLFADIDELTSRWTEVQATFVDDPRQSIAEADALVSDVMQRVTQRLAQQRDHLEASWHQGHEASTEDLRVALQHYRTFFHRLLTK